MFETFQLLLPQTVLIALACLFFLGGTTRVPARVWEPLAVAALALAAAALWYASKLHPAPYGTGIVLNTHLSLRIEAFCLLLGTLFVLSAHNGHRAPETAAEFYGLVLLIVVGMMLVAAAQELILLFLSLELISVPTYVLLYLGRRTIPSQEATVKYFLLSVVSAAILLYGFALLYGLSGTTDLSRTRTILAATYPLNTAGNPSSQASVMGVIALALIFAGLGFKLAAVPSHFYAPDVYQGTSAFNAGLLSVAPKAAAIVALVRVASETLVGYENSGAHLALILAAVTMVLGNCLAVLQTNVRRLLAYSGIAHAGYMLIGISVGFWESWHPDHTNRMLFSQMPGGIASTLLYLVTYCLATTGLFGVLVYLTRANGREIEHIDDLTGLGRTQPLMGVAAALFLFSLAGIPPLPGFWGKLSVIAASLNVHSGALGTAPQSDPAFVALAIVAMLSAAIGAVAYLRLIAVMYLSEPISVPQPAGGPSGWTSVAWSAALVIALGVWPRPLFTAAMLWRAPQAASSVTAAAQTRQPTDAAVIQTRSASEVNTNPKR